MPDALTEVAQLERIWNPGVGKQEYEYYSGTKRFADDLPGRPRLNATPAALRLLGSIVSRRPPGSRLRDADFEVGAVDVLAMSALTRFLLTQDQVSREERRETASASATVLGRIRSELQPDYVQRQVFGNVAPPARVPGMAGMDPAAIADPTARAEYVAAIRANKLNNLANKRQLALQRAEPDLAKSFIEYLSRMARSDAGAVNLVRQASAEARLTEMERAQVFPAPPQ